MQAACVRHDFAIEVWNWDSRTVERTVRLERTNPFKRMLSVAAFSPDGGVLGAACEFECYAQLWAMPSGLLLQTLGCHSLPVTDVAFSADVSVVATSAEDGTVKVWSVKSGECALTLEGHRKLVSCVAFPLIGNLLASGSLEGSVKLWCPREGVCAKTFLPPGCCRTHEVQPWEIQPEAVLSASFSPNGELLAAGLHGGFIVVWVVLSGHCSLSMRAHPAGIVSIVFSPSGSSMATCSPEDGGGLVKLWDVYRGCCWKEIKCIALQRARFLEEEVLMTSQCFPTCVLRLWNTCTGKETSRRELHDTGVPLFAPAQAVLPAQLVALEAEPAAPPA